MKPRRAVALGGLAAAGLLLFARTAAAEPRVFELSIRAGALPESSRLVRVRQGDDVTIRWTTDKPLTIHLHGYDLEAKLTPGAPDHVDGHGCTSSDGALVARGAWPVDRPGHST